MKHAPRFMIAVLAAAAVFGGAICFAGEKIYRLSPNDIPDLEKMRLVDVGNMYVGCGRLTDLCLRWSVFRLWVSWDKEKDVEVATWHLSLDLPAIVFIWRVDSEINGENQKTFYTAFRGGEIYQAHPEHLSPELKRIDLGKSLITIAVRVLENGTVKEVQKTFPLPFEK